MNGSLLSALAWAVVIVLALTLLGLGFFLLRVRRLLSSWGSSQCSVRGPHGWQTGVVFFRQKTLDWYSIRSLSNRPKLSIPRQGFTGELQERHETDPPTAIVKVKDPDTGHEYLMAMGVDTYNALVVWEDSAPPAASTPLF